MTNNCIKSSISKIVYDEMKKNNIPPELNQIVRLFLDRMSKGFMDALQREILNIVKISGKLIEVYKYMKETGYDKEFLEATRYMIENGPVEDLKIYLKTARKSIDYGFGDYYFKSIINRYKFAKK